MQGKKEKKRREKKGKAAANVVVVHPEAGYDGDQYDQEPAPEQSYAEVCQSLGSHAAVCSTCRT